MKRTFPRLVAWIGLPTAAVVALILNATAVAGGAGMKMTTKPFTGKKVNGGTVMHEHKDGKHVLTFSDDFKAPDAPDPHWQVVDSKGNTYLLQRLMVKGTLSDSVNKTIVAPAYVPDIAKVQIWCAYAEVLLGEAPFDSPVK